MKKLYKPRASTAFALATEPQTKAAKEAGELSETAKLMVRKAWLKNEYGRTPIADIMLSYTNKYMSKGTNCEIDSIKLIQQLYGGFIVKNERSMENDFITGTPDFIGIDCIEEIKTPWELPTFMEGDLSKQYYWQLQCYMWLTGLKKAKLHYCLVNTPHHLLQDDLRRLSWKIEDIDGTSEMFAEVEAEVMKNASFDDIPTKDRVKTFEVDYNEADIDFLKERTIKAREYYNTLFL